LGTGGLIGVAVVAVALLLVMVIKLKVHAFLALIIVSMLTAIVAGTPVDQVVPTMIWGFGDTLASVALLVAIGAMLGALVETSGGRPCVGRVQVPAVRDEGSPVGPGRGVLVRRLPDLHGGRLRADGAVRLARRPPPGRNPPGFGIPVAAALSVMHVYLP